MDFGKCGVKCGNVFMKISVGVRGWWWHVWHGLEGAAAEIDRYRRGFEERDHEVLAILAT